MPLHFNEDENAFVLPGNEVALLYNDSTPQRPYCRTPPDGLRNFFFDKNSDHNLGRFLANITTDVPENGKDLIFGPESPSNEKIEIEKKDRTPHERIVVTPSEYCAFARSVGLYLVEALKLVPNDSERAERLQFKLPDPEKHPECYRNTEDEEDPRIVIFWGMNFPGEMVSLWDVVSYFADNILNPEQVRIKACEWFWKNVDNGDGDFTELAKYLVRCCTEKESEKIGSRALWRYIAGREEEKPYRKTSPVGSKKLTFSEVERFKKAAQRFYGLYETRGSKRPFVRHMVRSLGAEAPLPLSSDSGSRSEWWQRFTFIGRFLIIGRLRFFHHAFVDTFSETEGNPIELRTYEAEAYGRPTLPLAPYRSDQSMAVQSGTGPDMDSKSEELFRERFLEPLKQERIRLQDVPQQGTDPETLKRRKEKILEKYEGKEITGPLILPNDVQRESTVADQLTELAITLPRLLMRRAIALLVAFLIVELVAAFLVDRTPPFTPNEIVTDSPIEFPLEFSERTQPLTDDDDVPPVRLFSPTGKLPSPKIKPSEAGETQWTVLLQEGTSFSPAPNRRHLAVLRDWKDNWFYKHNRLIAVDELPGEEKNWYSGLLSNFSYRFFRNPEDLASETEALLKEFPALTSGTIPYDPVRDQLIVIRHVDTVPPRIESIALPEEASNPLLQVRFNKALSGKSKDELRFRIIPAEDDSIPKDEANGWRDVSFTQNEVSDDERTFVLFLKGMDLLDGKDYWLETTSARNLSDVELETPYFHEGQIANPLRFTYSLAPASSFDLVEAIDPWTVRATFNQPVIGLKAEDILLKPTNSSVTSSTRIRSTEPIDKSDDEKGTKDWLLKLPQGQPGYLNPDLEYTVTAKAGINSRGGAKSTEPFTSSVFRVNMDANLYTEKDAPIEAQFKEQNTSDKGWDITIGFSKPIFVSADAALILSSAEDENREEILFEEMGPWPTPADNSQATSNLTFQVKNLTETKDYHVTLPPGSVVDRFGGLNKKTLVVAFKASGIIIEDLPF